MSESIKAAKHNKICRISPNPLFLKCADSKQDIEKKSLKRISDKSPEQIPKRFGTDNLHYLYDKTNKYHNWLPSVGTSVNRTRCSQTMEEPAHVIVGLSHATEHTPDGVAQSSPTAAINAPNELAASKTPSHFSTYTLTH